MKPRLLTAKLIPPAVSQFSVDREAICQRVFAAFNAKVVLVRAPAGFGKTTALAQLHARYQQEGTPVGWLTLDEGDNDLPRFLSYIEAMFSKQLTDAGPPSEEDAATRLSAFETQLLHSSMPFVLFLDEMEVLRDSAVLTYIRQAVARLPPNTRLVLGSRNVPEIGLGRLRAHGELLEITPEQLRFSAAEAKLFLTQRRGLTLTSGHIERLLTSTEGWPAALSLASVALERRPDPERFIAGFAGSDATVADYLAEDVLAGQPADVRDFLLKTSVLAQFDASLCNAICHRDDSADMLTRLERNHLFLSCIDDAQGLYRYHSLFRHFLQSQLERHGRELPAQLHRAAALWYLSQQRPIPAIDHALAGSDAELATALLEQHAEDFLGQGRLRLLTRWFEALPPGELELRPKLRLIYIWAVNFTQGPQTALALVAQIDASALTEPAVLAQFQAMQPTMLGMRDHIDASFELGCQRLALVSPEHGFAYAILAQTLANDSMIRGDYTEARRYADEAQAAQVGYGAVMQEGLAGAVYGAIDLIHGRLRQALAQLRLATGISNDDAPREGSRHLLPAILLAEALFEAGRWEPAEKLLTMFLPLAQNLGLPDQLIMAHCTLARIVENQGAHDRALETLSQLEALGHRLGLQRVIASARLERAHLLLLQGDISGADEQLQQAGDADWWQGIASRSFVANDKLTLAIAQLRWLIHSGKPAQAIAPLKQQLAEAESNQRQRRALKLQILLALALYSDNQPKPAMRMLDKALNFAAAEGFIGSFLEEGPRVQELLRARQNTPGSDPQTALPQHLANLLAQREKPTATAANSVGMEALSRKELQILELVGQGLTNDAMARQLFVSESTVRTHLRSINTKLHASNRMHAVALARQMQLID